jgi:hypothetical protein
MLIPGQRIKRTRLIQSEKYVVAVEVELVIPEDDPSEPCYKSETVQLLREIRERADRGDVAWLTQRARSMLRLCWFSLIWKKAPVELACEG